jgi:hypothetical protein
MAYSRLTLMDTFSCPILAIYETNSIEVPNSFEFPKTFLQG